MCFPVFNLRMKHKQCSEILEQKHLVFTNPILLPEKELTMFHKEYCKQALGLTKAETQLVYLPGICAKGNLQSMRGGGKKFEQLSSFDLYLLAVQPLVKNI